jgi:hypothetical protein
VKDCGPTNEQLRANALEMEREIFRRTPEGLALARARERWPFPEPVPAHKRPADDRKDA